VPVKHVRNRYEGPIPSAGTPMLGPNLAIIHTLVRIHAERVFNKSVDDDDENKLP
jgi:hypothetical protein